MGIVKCPECGATAQVIATSSTSAETVYRAEAQARCKHKPVDNCPPINRQAKEEILRLINRR